MNARESLRLLIRDFLDTATCEEDEEAWKQHRETYDDLLTEVERLRFIVDSIPDGVWKDMRTWDAMKGVIE